MSAQYPGRITISPCRLRFPKLETAEQFQGEGEYAYTAAFIIPPDHPQLAAIKAEMELVAKAKWPKDWQSVLKAAYAKDSNALHDGDIKSGLDGYEGNLYLAGRNTGKGGAQPKLKPSLYGPNKEELKDGRMFYDGCDVAASVEFWAQDNGYGKKINMQIRGVMFIKDNDAFSASGGSKAGADDFGDVTAGATADDFA